MEKANRFSGLMVSLALMKRRMACLIESNRVKGRPFGPVFISAIHSGSTSIQNSMSSLFIRSGLSVYLIAPDPPASIPSISHHKRYKARSFTALLPIPNESTEKKGSYIISTSNAAFRWGVGAFQSFSWWICKLCKGDGTLPLFFFFRKFSDQSREKRWLAYMTIAVKIMIVPLIGLSTSI